MASAGSKLKIIVDDKKFCTTCKQIKKEVKPTCYCTECEAYFCQECFEFHNRIPLHSKHIILTGTDIEVWETLPYKCRVHDKAYEFFCSKHDQLCCHVCVSLEHGACPNMQYIPKEAKGICSQSKFNDVKRNTEAEIKQLEELKLKFTEKSVVNLSSKDDFKKSLQEHRELINGLFDSLERRALDILDKKVSENAVYVGNANDVIQQQEKKISLLKRRLDSACNDKGVLVFICLRMGEKLLVDLRQEISKLDASTNKDKFKLVIHPDIEHYIRNLTDIGRLVDTCTHSEQDSASEDIGRLVDACTNTEQDSASIKRYMAFSRYMFKH